jgi:hypothetical protein
MPDTISEAYSDKRSNLQRGIKDRIFDVIALVIMLALILVSLGILERRPITWHTLGDIFVECIPFFFAAILLNDDYYKKGIYVGKRTKNFINACEEYTGYVSKLTGEQIDKLDDFCQEYTDDALKKKQISYLNRASMSYEKFHVGIDIEGETQDPVQTWSKDKLIHTYGKDRAKWIILAKNAKVKGLQVNGLMGTTATNDITDLGPSESQLYNRKRVTSAISYLFTTFVLALIGIKNITEWGWFGAALVLFKAVFIYCRALMTYFDGYNDVTVNLVSNTHRKTDVLKQFLYWYDLNYCQKVECVSNGNKIEKSE